MNVVEFTPWHRPGCGENCSPRFHDLDAHEAYGAYLERERQKAQIVRTGPLVVDLARRIATVHGEEIGFGSSCWEVLAYLASRLDEFCETREIQRAVWGSIALSEATVRTSVQRLRKTLGPAGRLLVSGHAKRGGARLVRVEPEA